MSVLPSKMGGGEAETKNLVFQKKQQHIYNILHVGYLIFSVKQVISQPPIHHQRIWVLFHYFYIYIYLYYLYLLCVFVFIFIYV